MRKSIWTPFTRANPTVSQAARGTCFDASQEPREQLKATAMLCCYAAMPTLSTKPGEVSGVNSGSSRRPRTSMPFSKGPKDIESLHDTHSEAIVAAGNQSEQEASVPCTQEKQLS